MALLQLHQYKQKRAMINHLAPFTQTSGKIYLKKKDITDHKKKVMELLKGEFEFIII